MGIKVELGSDSDCKQQAVSTTLSDKPKIGTLVGEKSNLVAEIMSLKSENQKICFELNEKKDELIKIKQKNEEKVHKLNEQLGTLSSKLKIAEAKAHKLKEDASVKQAIDAKSISDLISEKKVLMARVNQLQSGVLLNSSILKEKPSNDDPNVFEVEKVLDDKMIGRTRHYLIRWKGFGPNDDTWEKAGNLHCPTILKDYMKSKKK